MRIIRRLFCKIFYEGKIDVESKAWNNYQIKILFSVIASVFSIFFSSFNVKFLFAEQFEFCVGYIYCVPKLELNLFVILRLARCLSNVHGIVYVLCVWHNVVFLYVLCVSVYIQKMRCHDMMRKSYLFLFRKKKHTNRFEWSLQYFAIAPHGTLLQRSYMFFDDTHKVHIFIDCGVTSSINSNC